MNPEEQQTDQSASYSSEASATEPQENSNEPILVEQPTSTMTPAEETQIENEYSDGQDVAQEDISREDTTDTEMAMDEDGQQEPFVPGVITWTAAEYIDHDRDHRWYIGLAAGVVVLVGLAIFLLKDWLFAALVIVMAIALVVITHRPAREITYQVDGSGLTISEKHFPFSDFKSFDVVQEGAIYNLRLTPNKRFVPTVTAYLPNDQGEQIVDVLGAMLPMEENKPDIVDRLVSKTRI